MRWTFLTQALFAAAAGSCLLAPGQAGAWHATGHMITAQIAYDALTDEARAEVDRLIALVAEFTPGGDHAVTASLWSDELKRQGVEAFDSWHYINLPYRAAGDGVAAPAPRPENVVWAIGQATATLRGEAGDLSKSLMLRFLLHFVGDVHQPMHCVSRITAELPDGDRGGNDFSLGGLLPHLHAFWDDGAGAYPDFDGQDWRPLVRRLADEITREVPRSAVPEWTDAAAETWARESFRLAVDVAYDGIAEGARPTPEYSARARRVIRRRLALSGYRLGALLNDIFSGREAKP